MSTAVSGVLLLRDLCQLSLFPSTRNTRGTDAGRFSWNKPAFAKRVALPLTVVTNTSVQPGVVVPVRDARAAWVVSTEAVAHETRAVPGRSSSGR